MARGDFERRRFGEATHRLAEGFSRVLVLVSGLAWFGCLRNGVRSLGFRFGSAWLVLRTGLIHFFFAEWLTCLVRCV